MRLVSAFLLTLLLSHPPFAHASAFDAVVMAKGQAQRVVVNGRDGRNGSDGRDGRNGSDGANGFCPNDKTRDDGRDGENGENGQDGDRGEYGANGGDTLIHFDSPENLKQIFVQALGGEGGYGGQGGRGGRGGRGGYGCNGGSHGRNGWDGRDGFRGSNGSSGGLGSIYLKQGFNPHEPSITDTGITLRQLFETTTTLRKNFWLQKTGARALLAAQSQVANAYQEYQSTRTLFVKGVLTSDQKLSEAILAQYIRVSFNDTFTEPVLSFSSDKIIVFLSREQEGDTFIYKIDSIYNADDFFHFSAGIRGEIGSNRRILISDGKKNWGALPTTLQVRVQDRGAWKTFAIPASAIKLSAYGPEIMLAKVAGLSDYQGRTVRAEVVMSRNLKGRMLVRTFAVKHGL